MRLAVVLAALLPLTSCTSCLPDLSCALVNCSPCPSSIWIFVQDGAGQPVPDVTVTGVQATCTIGGEGAVTFCQARAPAGHYDLTLSAPGHSSGTVSIDVFDGPAQGGESCCGQCASSLPASVTLPPLS